MYIRRSAPEQPKWRDETLSSESLIHGKYADRYELNWKIPAHNGEPIDMYEISFCPVSILSSNVMCNWGTDELFIK